MSNQITAYFKGRTGVAEPVYQNDYGMVLNFDGISLPSNFDCHFSVLGSDTAIPGVGADNRVAIPNTVLSHEGNVTVHIPLHTGSDDSEVEYVVYFKVIGRARPEDDGTPVQMTAIEKALALLSQPITNIEEIVNEALSFTGETFDEMRSDLQGDYDTFAAGVSDDISDMQDDIAGFKTEIRGDISDVEADFTVLQGQFDTAVAAVTTDTEVTDIRVGADGVTDTTAGASVRRQFTALKEDFNVYQEDFVGVVNPINEISWTDGKAISSNGSITDTGGFHYSSLMPVKSGTYTFIWKAVDGSNTIRVHGYDSSGTWVQQIDTFASGVSGVQTKVLDAVPSTVTQVRLSIGIKHKPLALYTGDTIQAQVNKASKMFDLVVCGYDATPYQKAIGEAMALQGYGYVCNSTELDSGINAFIDSFMNTERTIYFFGTIRTAEGIHKHPKHNLVGYDCTLKMGDNLGADYISCVRPTNGGVPFSSANQVISHNNTFVKGFTFDGNCENNKSGDNYVHSTLYGGTICGEIYHETVYPYSQTQLLSDIVLEDIKAVETMRGIIVGIGWKCRNLKIGRAVTDHALYLAGADGAIVDNVYCTGRHLNGAIAISSQSWDANRKVKNIHLKNIFLDECNGIDGSLLDIRGHFSTWGNDKTLDDIFIDGLFINKRNNFQENVAITIGTYASNEHGDYTLADYPMNIHINNLVADIKLYNSFMRISNARTKIENSMIRVTNYRYDRALFQLQSKDILKDVFNFSGMTFISDATEDVSHAWTIFGIDNRYATHKVIHGININDLLIHGISNYYLFNINESGYNNVVSINDVSSERIIADPLGTINPATDKIEFVADDYYEL